MSQLTEIMSALAKNPDSSTKNLVKYIFEHDPVKTLNKMKAFIIQHDKGSFLSIIKNMSLNIADPTVTDATNEKLICFNDIRQSLLDFIERSNLVLLISECDEYLKHLEADVKKMIRQRDYDLYEKIFTENNKGEIGGLGVLIGHHDLLDEKRKPVSGEGTNFYNDRIKVGNLTPPGSRLFIALEKCSIVYSLRSTLVDSNVVKSNRMVNFNNIFNQGLPTLEKNTDSALIKFLNKVRKILFTIPQLKKGFFAEKKSHDEKFIDEAKKRLPSPIPTS